MTNSEETDRLERLVTAARNLGADAAKIIDSKKVVVDKRVRLKCAIPVCSSYGRHLMCPPNLMSVEEFNDALALYETALILQVEADYDSADKTDAGLNKESCDKLEKATNTKDWELKLHRIVNEVEALAFKEGFYLAAGLIGGDCALCPECVTPGSGEPCRRPFEARPSMEAMGIDVFRTCQEVGLPIFLSSDRKVRWTGIVLLY